MNSKSGQKYKHLCPNVSSKIHFYFFIVFSNSCSTFPSAKSDQYICRILIRSMSNDLKLVYKKQQSPGELQNKAQTGSPARTGCLFIYFLFF